MILDAFKFTNSLFVGNVSKFLIVVSPMFILQFLVYLVFTLVPGNEFGTTTSIAAQGQQLIINLISLYAMPLCILLIDDIHKERSRPISNYFTHALFFFFRILFISFITVFAIVFGLIFFIIPGFYIYARLVFAPFFAVVTNIGTLDSVKKSVEITEQRGWIVLGYILALVMPLLFILIFILIVPAVYLLPQNMHTYMAIVFSLSFLFYVYFTIYSYRIFINLSSN